MGPSWCTERLRNRRKCAGRDLTILHLPLAIRLLMNRIRVFRALVIRVLMTRGLLSEVASSEGEPSGASSP